MLVRIFGIIFVGVIAYMSWKLRGVIARLLKIKAVNPIKNHKRLRIGLLGVARIAPLALIYPARQIPDVEVVAVASRDISKAQKYAKKHKIPKVHKSYEDLIADPEIDAIYNPLPNSHHFSWTISALSQGKHVLCEKPFCSNAQEAIIMNQKSKEHNKVLIEAFHYRYHPATQAVKKILDSGKIGKIIHIKTELSMPSWLIYLLFKNDIRGFFSLSGGMTMDMGTYAINMLRYFTNEEPQVLSATPTFMFRDQVEGGMHCNFKFPVSGATGEILCGGANNRYLSIGFGNVYIKGEKGYLEAKGLVGAHIYHSIKYSIGDKKFEEKHYGDGFSTYHYQLQAYVQQVLNGGVLCPTDSEDAIKNMKVLDDVYTCAGLKVRGT